MTRTCLGPCNHPLVNSSLYISQKATSLALPVPREAFQRRPLVYYLRIQKSMKGLPSPWLYPSRFSGAGRDAFASPSASSPGHALYPFLA